MQPQQHQSNEQSIILVFPDEANTLYMFSLIQVDKECAADYVPRTYPTASHIIFMPDTFLSILDTLWKKNLRCSGFDNILLAYLSCKCK
jgi:hypothetical protein